MNRKEAELFLDGFARRLISPLGFESFKCVSYARPMNDATAILSFGGRVDPWGRYSFTLGMGLHFEAISKWLDDDPAEKRATVGTPVHLLRGDKSYTEWKFSNASELEGLRGVISDNLNHFALPFLEHYSKLFNLRKAVASSSSKDWIDLGLDQDRRVSVLAAIQAAQGDKPGALTTLDAALAERKTALPKRRFEIERLRKRLVEAW